MINAALAPLESQLLCLRNISFSCFDLGEDTSSSAGQPTDPSSMGMVRGLRYISISQKWENKAAQLMEPELT